jgi:hypothetical protein
VILPRVAAASDRSLRAVEPLPDPCR